MAKIDASAYELTERVVTINRVSKTVKGGRIFKFAALVIAGGPVRAVVETVGIRDIRAKALRSNNPCNVVRATLDGLAQLRNVDEVAAIRGKSEKEILG